MYIAMNRFRIAPGHEEDFERLWRERDSQLDDVPGFVEFRLLRGPNDEEATLYASHTVWRSEDDFRAELGELSQGPRAGASAEGHLSGTSRVRGLRIDPLRFGTALQLELSAKPS